MPEVECCAGIGSIRCKWGSVQEATALWEFMHAVPQGALEEVGLCRVEPAVLRDQYGFAEGQLPPMGASPDGLVRQRQASPASAVCLIPLFRSCNPIRTHIGWHVWPLQASIVTFHLWQVYLSSLWLVALLV